MPATQISFLDFAQSQALALQAAPPCTLPIVAVHAPALVVAHDGGSGGECTSYYANDALYELVWKVRLSHGAMTDPSLPLDSRGSAVLQLRYLSSGGASDFVSDSDRVSFYEGLREAAALCIGHGL